jgi:hypothetical protein
MADWASTPLRTIIPKTFKNNGNKKRPNIVRSRAKEKPPEGG